MPTVPQINVRLQLGVVSNPPVPPIDINTGLAPQAWRGASLAVDIGIFDQQGGSVDLSNLDYIEADIFPASILNTTPGTNYSYAAFSNLPFPNLPPAPQLFSTVEADDIEPTISFSEWQAGNVQQARALFTWEQMQSLDLGGKPSAEFLLVVHGLTDAGERIIYGAAQFLVYESGAQGVYLPNNLAPLVVPAGTILYIPPNQQMPYSVPIDIEGVVNVDGILVQV